MARWLMPSTAIIATGKMRFAHRFFIRTPAGDYSKSQATLLRRSGTEDSL